MAYNEQDSIAATLRSIFEQELVTGAAKSGEMVEIIVVPNGCSDETAARANDSLFAAMSKMDENHVAASVCELAEAGKENAWNHFVHEVSCPDAQYLILMDADVRLEHPRVLGALVDALEAHRVSVAGGTPTKHIELKRHKTVFDRISLGASTLRRGMPGVFAGCLYCGRAEILRSFRLPSVLMGEDAFVRAMIVTRGFTQQDDPGLVRNVPEARVIFEAYQRPSEIIRNKTRRMIELAINAALYTKFWAESTPERPAGTLTKEWFEADPRWSEKYIEEVFAMRGRSPIPRSFITGQFRQLRHHRFPRRLALLPVGLATLPLNAWAVRKANRAICSGEIRSLWDKKAASREQGAERSGV